MTSAGDSGRFVCIVDNLLQDHTVLLGQMQLHHQSLLHHSSTQTTASSQ